MQSGQSNIFMNRLSSFEKWPLKERFPPGILAEGGFIYKEGEHVLVCANCGCQISEFHISSQTHIQNNTQSCSCTMSIERCLNHSGDSNVIQTVDKYKDYAMRLETYQDNWPRQVPVEPEDLAQAGLFFTGKNDRVQCPWCMGILYNWEYGDSGYGEHTRHFPSCPFVIEKLQEPSWGESSENHQTMHDFKNTTQTEEPLWSELPCVKAIMDLDYSFQDIERAVGLLVTKGIKQADLDTDMILDEIFGEETNTQETPRKCDDASIVSSQPPTDVVKQKTGVATENNKLCKQPKENLSDVENLKKENEVLKSNMTCKICLDAPVGELFLPCRHLVCCVQCSVSIQKCPVCRETIIGTIKTFI